VTNAHQSDFAEALMGHSSVKLTYYRQNSKERLRTYLQVEPSLTISDYSTVENTMESLHKEIEHLKSDLAKVQQWKEMAKRYEKVG